MSSLAPSPEARRLLVISILARVPGPMLGVGLLVHARHLTGSFAVAGIVTALYGAAIGVGGPLLGRIVDRRGQTAVLLQSASAAAVLLVAIGLVPPGTSPAVLAGLAMGIGLATPPVGACLRAVLPGVVRDPAQVRAAYAAEASAFELTWVCGPPLVLGIGAVSSTGTALAACGVLLLTATAAFAAQGPSRAWRPDDRVTRPRGGALRAPAMQTLVLVTVAAGVLFGAAEIAVTAAAATLQSTTLAAPLMALWGTGSVAGGLVAVRLGGGAGTPRGLVLPLGALTAGHVALMAATTSAFALGTGLLLAGAAIGPTFAALSVIVDRVAPDGTATEAFAWIATAEVVGGALGSAVTGAVMDQAGAMAGFGLAGIAGAAAVLIAIARAATLRPPDPPEVVVYPGASAVGSSRLEPTPSLR